MQNSDKPSITSETRNSKGRVHSFHDKPAEIWSDGTTHWCKEDAFHREIGPAVTYLGRQAWFWEGEQIR